MFNKKSFGLSLGIIWGLLVFLTTLWIKIKGGGNTLILLEQFYFGYSISFKGAIIGGLYGFIDGFVLGWIFVWLYNIFAKE